MICPSLCLSRCLYYLLMTGSVRTRSSITTDLQLDLDSLSLWSLTNNIAFNAAKSALLSFPHGSVPSPHFVSGIEIPMVSSTCDLGVLISDTLSWSDHILRITSKAYKMLGLVCRSFSNKLPVSVKKSLYLSLVRSHLMYCSVIWRPYDIILLEKIQRRASKFLLNDYSSVYKTRLMSLNLLPLSMVMELNDIIFFLKSLRTPSSTFNILDYVSFCISSTRSSSSHKLRHPYSSTTLSSHFYFSRLPRHWNSLPSIDPFNLPLSSVISHIKTYFWSHFIDHFNPSDAHFTSPVCALSVFTPSLTLLILLQQFNIILL